LKVLAAAAAASTKPEIFTPAARRIAGKEKPRRIGGALLSVA